MLSQYLLIYSEAIKATIKEIKAKTQNQLFYDPSLTHKGGSGVKLTGYLDSPYMLVRKVSWNKALIQSFMARKSSMKYLPLNVETSTLFCGTFLSNFRLLTHYWWP